MQISYLGTVNERLTLLKHVNLIKNLRMLLANLEYIDKRKKKMAEEIQSVCQTEFGLNKAALHL